MKTGLLFASLLTVMLITDFGYSHDAFYPHHRDDFDSLTRRKELRGAVLIITLGFVAILAGVFYIALRSGRKADREVYETEQKHLEHATKKAAQAVQTVLRAHGHSEAAIRAALAAYAEASGAVWNPKSVIVNGQSIRCKIGREVVIVSISDLADRYEIEVSALRDEANRKSLRVTCEKQGSTKMMGTI